MSANRIPVAILAASVLALAGVTMSTAVTPAQAQESYSDATLQSFAKAATKLVAIQSEYQSQMQAAENDNERQTLIQQANKQMTKAVEETSGISVQQYNKIATESRSNQGLQQKISKYMQDTSN